MLLASHRRNMAPPAISDLDQPFCLKCVLEYWRPADLQVRAPSTQGTEDGTPGVRLGGRRLYSRALSGNMCACPHRGTPGAQVARVTSSFSRSSQSLKACMKS